MKKIFLVTLLFCCCYALMAQSSLFIARYYRAKTEQYEAVMFRTNWFYLGYGKPVVSIGELEGLCGKNYRWANNDDVKHFMELDNGKCGDRFCYGKKIAALGSCEEQGGKFSAPYWYRNDSGDLESNNYTYNTYEFIQQKEIPSDFWGLIIIKDNR